MTDREMLKKWVDAWREAGPMLEEVWRREVAELDTRKVIQDLVCHDNFCADLPPRTTSGLVEQQHWFARLRQQV